MCVMGLVTLMLNRPAMHRRKPNMPVTRVPQRNTGKFQVASLVNLSQTLKNSPLRTTTGKSMRAEPTLVHQARCIVDPLQWGRELLIRTAWIAIKSDDRTP